MPDGPPESAHCRSAYAWSPGSVVGTGVPNVAPPSVEVCTHMLWLPSPDRRLCQSRYTRGLPVVASFGPTAIHCRSVSSNVAPVVVCHDEPRSSEYELRKLMAPCVPAKSSSLETIRPVGVTTMSVSI